MNDSNKENNSKNCLNEEPSVDCFFYASVGIYCIFLFIVSLISNSKLIWIIYKNKKELLHQINILILVLAILSLVGTLFGLPLIIITGFYCKFVNLVLLFVSL
jgi:hypothetical protein